MPNSSVEINTQLLDEIKDNVDCDGIYLKAGVMEKGINLRNGSEIDPRKYAYFHEMGIGVPQRSFLRSTLNENKDEWTQILSALLEKNNYDVSYSLREMMDLVSTSIQEKFNSNNWEPLKPETIKRKQRAGYPKPDSPLIETSTLMSSISAEVVEK